MLLLTSKPDQAKAAAMILLALLLIVFCRCGLAGEYKPGETNSDETIMVNNVWVDVPLGQVLRDISIETGIIIATCPHVPDPLVSLDAGMGKPLDECLSDLIAGQGLFIHKRNKKFYLIHCGDPTCPSALETTTSKRLYLKYISAKHLQTSLPKSAQQYVTSGQRDNEVLIYAVPEITEHIMDIINKLDVPRQQVMLEVLVVDLWEDSSDELGLDWNISSPHSSFGLSGNASGFTGLANYASVASSNLTQLNLTLRALVAKKRASIRSRPRVATLNGEKATIDISLDEYFTIATDLYGSSLRTELEVIKSGVMLEITPHIGDKGNITVDVHTEVSDVASRRNSSGNSNISGEDLPVIRRRKAETHVRVRQGDAIVIGGLIETQETTNHKSVPLLSSIPLVSGLFKSKEDSTVRKEVMIFITPRLMNEGQTALSDSHKLINETQEVAKLRDANSLIDPQQKICKKTDTSDQQIQWLNETVNLLGSQEPLHKTSQKTDTETTTASPDDIAQQRKLLQDVIALLDVKKEKLSPVMPKQEKNYKCEASCGVIGK